jgi:hypothetical protein
MDGEGSNVHLLRGETLPANAQGSHLASDCTKFGGGCWFIRYESVREGKFWRLRSHIMLRDLFTKILKKN